MAGAAAQKPGDIRNVVMLGHGGAGKTTLVEAILHKCGATTRMGSVEEGNTVADFEPEAKAHKNSTSASLVFVNYEGKQINLIDTPGYPDFIGQALATLPAVETAVVVVNAAAGIEVNTRRMFAAAGEAGLARMVVINRMDIAADKLEEVLKQLQETFGQELRVINLPTGGGADTVDCFERTEGSADILNVGEMHQQLVESVVEVDDAALEKYLGGETVAPGVLKECLTKAIRTGHVVPVAFTSAKREVGIGGLLRVWTEYLPSPVAGKGKKAAKGEGEKREEVEVAADENKPLLGHVFKVTTDAYIGKLAMVRLWQGKMDPNTPFVCGDGKKSHKAGHVLKVMGKDHPEMGMAYAGDIIGLAKVEDIQVNQMIHDPNAGAGLEAMATKYPTPMYSLAIEPKNRGDETKISGALHKLEEEDATFTVTHDHQTHELVINGIGDLHLRIMLEKMKNRFNLEVNTKPPKIPYRETIQTPAEGHYRHKKQTGGAGQFGEVYLKIEPLARGQGFEYVNDTFGGSIPAQYIPSVEKGVRDVLEIGAVAGYPMQDVKVSVTDGKYHPVDSKDIAFRIAGRNAFKDAITKAKPTLLEPIVNVEITIPEQYMGDITGDLNGRRGRVIGVDTLPGGMAVIKAEAPLSELATYNGQLRSVTSGQGSFTMELSHYDLVPPQVQAKIVAAYKPKEEVE